MHRFAERRRKDGGTVGTLDDMFIGSDVVATFRAERTPSGVVRPTTVDLRVDVPGLALSKTVAWGVAPDGWVRGPGFEYRDAGDAVKEALRAMGWTKNPLGVREATLPLEGSVAVVGANAGAIAARIPGARACAAARCDADWIVEGPPGAEPFPHMHSQVFSMVPRVEYEQLCAWCAHNKRGLALDTRCASKVWRDRVKTLKLP